MRICLPILLVAAIMIASSCIKKNEPPKENLRTTIGPEWESRNKDLDSFISKLKNRDWPEILLKDTVPSFISFADTFYVQNETFDTVYILFQLHTESNKWFYNRHVCIESNKFGGSFWPTYVINCPIQFTNCTFYFDRYKFLHSLHDITFKSFTIFQNNVIPDSTVFQNLNFESNVNFLDTSQKGYFPTFFNCSFLSGISFNLYQQIYRGEHGMMYLPNGSELGCTFRSDVIFTNCRLSGTLSFKNCSFTSNSSLVMEDTFLPDTLDLSSTKIAGILDLTGIRTKNKICYINLLNADIDKIKFRYNYFKLYFPNKFGDSIEIQDLISSTYERVLNNFKINGFTDSYKKLDIEYSEWKSKSDLIYKISDIWWKFGYQKWRIIIFTICFIFLFSTYNYRKYKILQSVYPIERLKWGNVQYSPNRFLYILRKFFAVYLYTGLIFFRLSIDFKNLNFRPMRFVALIIFEYAIGLVCTGFLINWILKG